MPSAIRSLLHRAGWLYPVLLLGAFLIAGIFGYVYTYDPAPDRVVVSVDGDVTDPAGAQLVRGTITEVADGRLLLESDGEVLDLALPSDTPVDELRRVSTSLEAGAMVNVGIQRTEFGLVLSGIVAVEDAP